MGTANQGAEDFSGTDRFLVQKQLGSGAFGVVYQVYDRQERSRVALKVLRNNEADALYRFKKDFRSLADIRHPNLVSFYELFSEKGLWFFTMELVPGPDFVEYLTGRPAESWPSSQAASSTMLDLSSQLRHLHLVTSEPEITTSQDSPAPQGSPLSEPSEAAPPIVRSPEHYARIRRVLHQLALGLHTVHQHGKVHRDIKPSNVLVTPEVGAGGGDRVVLLDFGLVTELQQTLPLETELQLMGTPAYMSPEQALALPGAPASDWYSVGVMLYQVLVGEVPFQGSLAELIRSKQIGTPPNPRERVADLPEDLERLCVGLLDPDPETRMPGEEVLRCLDQGPLQVGSQGQDSPRERLVDYRSSFVGRHDVLAELDKAFATSRERAVAVYVRGASGMGKTALVQKFSEDLLERDEKTVVLSGRCYLQESVPYKAFDSLIDELSHFLLTLPPEDVAELLPAETAELSRLFPVLQRVPAIHDAVPSSTAATDPAVSRRRAFWALRELLARLAARQPLVLVFDDLQWGDADSFFLLERLLEPPEPPPLLLLACYRSEDEAGNPFLGTLAAHRRELAGRGATIYELELESLSTEESRDLVNTLEDQGCEVSSDHVQHLITESGGSPLFLSELTRYARQTPHGAPSLSAASPGGEGRPLHGLIFARIEGLRSSSRRLLTVIAVAGRPLEAGIACQAADVVSASGEALAELRTHRLIRQSPTRGYDAVETYHDHIREAVIVSLDDEALRHIHRSLALALESSGQAEPEALAVHFRAIEEVGRAREYAVSAAERSERALAFERAAKLYRQALDLLDDDTRERYHLRVRLGAALANAGRGHEAAETYLGAVRDAVVKPEDRRDGDQDLLEVQRLAAEKLLISGHIDRGLAVLRHVLRHVGMSLDARSWKSLLRLWMLRLRLRVRGFRFRNRLEADCDPDLLRRIDVCWSVEIGLCLVDVLHASEFHARHLLMALAAGEPQRVARGLAMEIFFGAMEGGDVSAAHELSQNLADSVDGRYPSCLTEMATGMAACSRGDWPAADRRLSRAEKHLREIGTGGVWELDTARHFRIIALRGLGRWQDLFAELPSLLETARAQGNLYLEIHLRHWGETLRHLAADRPGEAGKIAHETIASWSHQGFHYQHFGRLYAEVEVALYRGNGRAAWRLVEDGWGELADSLIQRIEMVLVQSHDLRGRAALAAAARETDRRFQAGLLARAENDARHLTRVDSPWSRGLAEMISAGVAASTGKSELALARLSQAEELFEAQHMVVHRLVARRRQAQLGGAETVVTTIDQELRGLGLVCPERFADVLAPGCWA